MKVPFPRTRGAWIRLGLALGMVGLISYYFGLTISNRVSIDGRINAEILPQVAQIDGTLVGQLPRRGDVVLKGQVVARLRADRIDDRTLTELAQEVDATRARARTLGGLEQDLRIEYAALAERRAHHVGLMQQRLQAAGEELVSSRAMAVEEMALARVSFERGLKLEKTANIPPSQLDTLRHGYQKSKANVARIDALIAQNKADQAAIQRGVTLSGNYADVPYTTQRMDEIAMRLMTLNGEMQDLKARKEKLEGRYAAESRRLDKLREQDIVSPVNGVVWRGYDTEGQEVLRGATVLELIDCSKVFVEATVYERFVEKVSPGQIARVKLLGHEHEEKARVRSVLGSAVNIHTDGNVAVPMRKNPGEATVLLSIEEETRDFQTSMCGVGRSAEVTFDQKDEAEAATEGKRLP